MQLEKNVIEQKSSKKEIVILNRIMMEKISTFEKLVLSCFKNQLVALFVLTDRSNLGGLGDVCSTVSLFVLVPWPIQIGIW